MKKQIFLLLCLSACAPKLAEDPNDVEKTSDTVRTLLMEDGSFDTTIDATQEELWVAFSLDSGEEVFVVDQEKSRDWDLRFSRFNIRINSGVSGIGEVEVAVLQGAEYDSVIKAPAGEYFVDESDLDMDGDQDLAFRRPNDFSTNGWFEYDPRWHTVTPAEIVYVVHAMNGIFYKLEILDYYDENKEGGYPRFRWTVIGSP